MDNYYLFIYFYVILNSNFMLNYYSLKILIDSYNFYEK